MPPRGCPDGASGLGGAWGTKESLQQCGRRAAGIRGLGVVPSLPGGLGSISSWWLKAGQANGRPRLPGLRVPLRLCASCDYLPLPMGRAGAWVAVPLTSRIPSRILAFPQVRDA